VGARIRLPLGVLLPCVAVCLAASGAAAIGAVCVRAGGSYVIREADDGLRACASSTLSHGTVAVPGSGAVAGHASPVPCKMELLSVSGRVLIPAPADAGGPAVPASGSWLAAHLAGPVTVPGSGNSGRWRVAIKVVHYQAQRMLFVFGPDDLRYLISGPAGHGSAGMLVVMAGLAGTGQPAAVYAAAAGTVLVLLAAAAFAVTRAILRPQREAARLAADAGHMAGHLEQACLQLRRPAGIVHGFTEYCRKHGRPPPAALDQMMRRVTGEITRMEALVDGLRMRSAARQPAATTQRDRPREADPYATVRTSWCRRGRSGRRRSPRTPHRLPRPPA
jgi:hypothetical protein